MRGEGDGNTGLAVNRYNHHMSMETCRLCDNSTPRAETIGAMSDTRTGDGLLEYADLGKLMENFAESLDNDLPAVNFK